MGAEKARLEEVAATSSRLISERTAENAKVLEDTASLKSMLETGREQVETLTQTVAEARRQLGQEKERRNTVEKDFGAAIVRGQNDNSQLEQRLTQTKESLREKEAALLAKQTAARAVEEELARRKETVAQKTGSKLEVVEQQAATDQLLATLASRKRGQERARSAFNLVSSVWTKRLELAGKMVGQGRIRVRDLEASVRFREQTNATTLTRIGNATEGRAKTMSGQERSRY